MTPNPDFVRQVKEAFPDTRAALVVGCQSGKRSDAAAQLLEQAVRCCHLLRVTDSRLQGYAEVTDMTGGYGAWASSGLPTTQ